MLKKKYENGKAKEEVIAVFAKEASKLSSIANKISTRVNADENLMAENLFAVQVDNSTAAFSRLSTVMNKFRFIIESEPGNAIEGMNAVFKSSVLYLNKNFDSKVDTGSSDSEDADDEFYAVHFLFNNKEVDSKKIAGSRHNVNASTRYESSRLNPLDSNLFSVAVYHSDDNEKQKRIGYLNYIIPVNIDKVKPVWLSESIPNLEDRYVQTLRAVSLTVTDQFGKIDPDSLSANINGSSDSGNLISKDVAKLLLQTKTGDGSSYNWSGDINPLDEGEYVFSASVKDLAGNNSDLYSTSFRIDRTPPAISLDIVDNALTNQFSFDIPVQVTDKSPAFTDIYVNDVLFFSTGSKRNPCLIRG